MNREELIKALRLHAGFCLPCIGSDAREAADMLENDQRHIEALMAEIEKLRKQLDRTNAEATNYVGELAAVAAERDAAGSRWPRSRKETVKYIQVPTLYPMGEVTFSIACSVCKNRNSSLCNDCRCEKNPDSRLTDFAVSISYIVNNKRRRFR